MNEKRKRGVPKGTVRALYCSGCGVLKTAENTYTRKNGPAAGTFVAHCKKCDIKTSTRFQVTEKAKGRGGREWLNGRIGALTKSLEFRRMGRRLKRPVNLRALPQRIADPLYAAGLAMFAFREHLHQLHGADAQALLERSIVSPEVKAVRVLRCGLPSTFF